MTKEKLLEVGKNKAKEHAHECFPYNASGNSPLHEVHLLNQSSSYQAGFAAAVEMLWPGVEALEKVGEPVEEAYHDDVWIMKRIATEVLTKLEREVE